MAKKKKLDQVEGGVDLLASITSAMVAVEEDFDANAEDYFGSYGDYVGIPIPSLAMQWLLNTTVWPLSRVAELAGEEGSRKSTFLYELMRWFVDAGGYAVMFETESKDNSHLRHAIMDYKPERISRIRAGVYKTYEDWAKALNSVIASLRESMSSSSYAPVLLCVDSIMGVGSEKDLEEIAENKVLSQKYPYLQKALTGQLRVLPSALMDLPISFVFTNHQKQKIDGMGGNGTYRGGGAGLRFAEAISLRFKPTFRDAHVVRAGYTVANLMLHTNKSAYGDTHMETPVSIVYKQEHNPLYDGLDPYVPKYRDKIYFDWEATDIKFLLSVTSSDGVGNFDKDRRREIASVLNLKTTKNLVYSDVLSIPESEPVSHAVAGAMLHSRPDLLSKLQDELGIIRRPAYEAGMDYRKFLCDVSAHSRTVTTKIIEQKLQEGDSDTF